MNTFGNKIATLRKNEKISQQKLAKLLNTSTSVIGRYERDEMIPSIEVAKKLAKILNTSIAYLLGEVETEKLFKNPEMLKRLNDIDNMNSNDKEHVLFTIDALIQKVKISEIT